jgi:integrase/recombinase XerD
VPAVAAHKGTGLPRGISHGTLTRLLASCDRRTRVGRRDHAILLLLARLGLRSGEVARLALADFDWRAGNVLVHGKGGRDEWLPLPADWGPRWPATFAGAGRIPTAGRCSCGRSLRPWG